MRLKNDTPAKIALNESLNQRKKNIGRPLLTWIKLTKKDLSILNIKLDIETNTAENTMNSLGELTASRKDWKRIVKDIMAGNR